MLDERRLRQAVTDWSTKCGRRLAIRRRAMELTQEQLAVMVGVRSTAISKFELGLITPKDSTRLAIACALLVEVNEIWPPLERDYVLTVAHSLVA